MQALEAGQAAKKGTKVGASRQVDVQVVQGTRRSTGCQAAVCQEYEMAALPPAAVEGQLQLQGQTPHVRRMALQVEQQAAQPPHRLAVALVAVHRDVHSIQQ